MRLDLRPLQRPDMMRTARILLCLLLAASPAAAAGLAEGLVGAARIPSNARDSLGETLGGFGSGMALVPGSWHGAGGHFSGTLAMLPDRGWNTQGTSDYRARLQYFDAELTPHDGVAAKEQIGLTLRYRKSLLFTDAAGAPTTGLDPTTVRPAGDGFPDLPVAANGHVSMDSESVAMPGKSGFWVGEEYGPYIYHFDAQGPNAGGDPPARRFHSHARRP